MESPPESPSLWSRVTGFFGKKEETPAPPSGTAPAEALGPDGVQGGRKRRKSKKTRKQRKSKSKRVRTGRRSNRL